MNQIPAQPLTGTYSVFRVILLCEAVVFLFAALLHTGAFGVPALLPAMIVEGLCGFACVISAYAVFAHRPWAKKTAILVQFFILAGVLLGIFALVSRPGLRTPINISLHGIMLALILIGLSLLAIPATRARLGSDHPVQSGQANELK